MKALSKIAVSAAGLLFATSSFSAVVWDESLDGDLSDSTGDPIISLSDGDNEIVGPISHIGNPANFFGSGDRGDKFTFILAQDQVLNSVDMLLTAINPLTLSRVWQVTLRGELDTRKFAHSPTRQTSFPIDNNGVVQPTPFDVASFTNLNLTDGLYRGGISISGSSYSTGAVANVIFDYTITANVSTIAPVPIPAAAWLFGSACVGLFGRRMVQCEVTSHGE